MTISVVMATHNGVAFVEEQLNTIALGTVVPDELVVVDDASTDGTGDLLEACRKNSNIARIILIRNEKNLGPTPSFLKALDRSTGDIVFFADQDDHWAPDKIESLAACFKSDRDLLLAYCDGTITNAELEPTGRTIFSTRNKAHLALGGERDLMEVMSNPDIKGCTMALNGAFARRVSKDSRPDVSTYWGHDHWLALFAYGMGPVKVVPRQLLLHRFHGSNASSATRFDPLSTKHWKKWSSKLHEQGKDHWYQRYALVKEHVDQHGYTVVPEWANALRTWIEIGKERQAIGLLPVHKRLPRVLALKERGIYRRYYNGPFTLLRDLLA
ncbi:MAG: glycosyltransferase [Flavobacteriales bacterium]